MDARVRELAEHVGRILANRWHKTQGAKKVATQEVTNKNKCASQRKEPSP